MCLMWFENEITLKKKKSNENSLSNFTSIYFVVNEELKTLDNLNVVDDH